jgi:pimeloyl-ACP methyl ester carboxylesterase
MALAVLSVEDGRPIHEARYLALGGIEQWITIRADDDTKPVLLLVHGGPGDVQSPLVSTYRPYERDFVLVQWDQRGAGLTYARHRDSTPDLTLEQVAADGIALAESLSVRFGRRVVVFGHSWGTAIATLMVQRRPELFLAYVGTGQIASWAESVEAQFEFLRGRARATGDRALAAELDSIGRPDPMNAEQYFHFTRSLRQSLDESDAAWLGGLRALLADSNHADLTAIGDGMQFSGRTLLPTQMRETLSTDALRFELPYFVIQGRDDRFTPTAPVERYFARVRAPVKRLVVLEGAGHFALATHAARVSATLRSLVAPLVR